MKAKNLKQTETSSVQEFRLNIEEYVHRHIELTAVLTVMLEQQKRVRESEDLNKRLAFVYKKARKSRL